MSYNADHSSTSIIYRIIDQVPSFLVDKDDFDNAYTPVQNKQFDTKTNGVFSSSFNSNKETSSLNNPNLSVAPQVSIKKEEQKPNLSSNAIQESSKKEITALFNVVNKQTLNETADDTPDNQKSIEKDLESSLFQDIVMSEQSKTDTEIIPNKIDTPALVLDEASIQQASEAVSHINETNRVQTASINKTTSNGDLMLQANESNLNKACSSQSIASNLSNYSQASQQQKSREQRQQQVIQEMAELPEWIKDNTRVIVSTNTVMNKTGHIRFIGPTKFAHGVWIGVELDQPFGKNDGSLNNVRYFTCPENRGVFVKSDKISEYVNNFE